MLRKFQMFLIRMIAAGRPVMLNVNVNSKDIIIYGQGAWIQDCTIVPSPPELSQN